VCVCVCVCVCVSMRACVRACVVCAHNICMFKCHDCNIFTFKSLSRLQCVVDPQAIGVPVFEV
jgi:hypothetical protein